ncbi:conserved hypothetical protein [Ricinus communis]|uniref:Reverse transcriptase domain-containing protein n=1 Tax=Ricinus communis TaxID=3988 RepID=B9SLA2_RICCO|nr:conserved hypothetical protein [Ricinus communis]
MDVDHVDKKFNQTLGNPLAVQVLKHFIKSKDPDFIFVMEKKSFSIEMTKIAGTISYIIMCVRMAGGIHEVSNIVAPSDLAFQMDKPRIFLGDFNKIMFQHEKSGGLIKENVKLDAFRSSLSDCGMDDMEYNRAQRREKRRVYHFEMIWSPEESCRTMVEDSWKNLVLVDSLENSNLILATCGEALKEWKLVLNIGRVLDVVDLKVHDDMNANLKKQFSKEEINGTPGAFFAPSRGLHQGGPLSPYLFLFCAEAFASLIRKAESAWILHGVKVYRRAPSVSYLFFKDDYVIFAKANKDEIDVIKHLIQDYEVASGHMIGRSKKEIFRQIEGRVNKKLKVWKEKLLSNASKMIHIKLVSQAIPTYMMC